METEIVPEDQWIEFFDRFSRDHTGEPVTIQVLDEEAGPLKIAQDLPLQGISFDKAGSRACVIQVGAGDEPSRHVNHVVDMPLNIRQVQELNGSLDIQIEPAAGPVTLVHLSGPIHERRSPT